MAPVKTIPIFGDSVEILTTGEMTGGGSVTLVHISRPGGGPPPHVHESEDETFYALEGHHEILCGGQWLKLAPGECLHSQRGSLHTFRNVGQTPAKMLTFVRPAGFDRYLEEISPLSVPNDISKLVEISARYGIRFPGLDAQ